MQILREKNTGLCKLTGKKFKGVMNHFIVGWGKTNLIADADDNMKSWARKG